LTTNANVSNNPRNIHISNVVVTVVIFSKGRKDMVFHGFVDHVKDYVIGEIPHARKNNITTLMKHKLLQPNVQGIVLEMFFVGVRDSTSRKANN
jgi:hypothetical protein